MIFRVILRPGKTEELAVLSPGKGFTRCWQNFKSWNVSLYCKISLCSADLWNWRPFLENNSPVTTKLHLSKTECQCTVIFLYTSVTENHTQMLSYWAVIQFHDVPEDDVLWWKNLIPYWWLVGDNMTFYILEWFSVYIYIYLLYDSELLKPFMSSQLQSYFL